MLVSAPPRPNPNLIAWARREAGYDAVRVAKRLGVKPEQVEGWEANGKPPTVRQLMNLAAFLERPLSLFFQETPPRLTPLAAEYRRLPNVTPGAETPELRLAIRHMVARRRDAIDLFDELDEEIPEFGLRAHLSDDPIKVGQSLRERIAIPVAEQEGWKDSWQAWREWRSAIEQGGVLVFMFPKVDMSEVRGLALLRTPLPVVSVNTKEIAEARPYTALHETVHLMLAMADEEKSALEDQRSAADLRRVERFAEIAASHALVPEDALAHAVGDNVPMDVDSIRRLAARFKITPLATATRLQQSGYLTVSQYRTWRTAWDEYVRQLPAKSKGFATPVSKTLGRGGRMFAQLVMDAYDTNRITTADAARYLNLRPDHFDTLRLRLVAGTSAESRDE